VGRDVSIDSEALLVTNFVNLNTKSTQFFRCAYRDRVRVCVFIELSARIYIYEYLCFYCVSNKIHLSVFGKITKIDINASLGHLLIAYILIGFAFNIQVEMGITYIYMKIDDSCSQSLHLHANYLYGTQ
jgi:hypothetical protein